MRTVNAKEMMVTLLLAHNAVNDKYLYDICKNNLM